MDDSSQVQDHSALMSPVTIADMQQQIRENNALIHGLREELRQSSLARLSFGPSSPSLSTGEPPKDPTARVLENSISLFATESSVVGSHKRRSPVSSLTSACPDVKPYLSRPQVDWFFCEHIVHLRSPKVV